MSLPDWQARTGLILSAAALTRLEQSTVAVFGLGGVGGHAAEAIVRAGVGRVALIDGDVYQPSNLNRQLGALVSTLGQPKAAVMAARARDINPSIEAEAVTAFYHPDTAADFPLESYDFIVDAVDMVTAKIDLITRATALKVPILSVMGTGWKRDPARLRIIGLDKTHSCPLARVMRRELGQRGIRHLPVVWTDEPPFEPEGPRTRGDAPGSLPWVPGAAGLLAASYVVARLTEEI